MSPVVIGHLGDKNGKWTGECGMQLLEVSDTPFHELTFRSSGRGGKVKKVVLPFYKAWADLPLGLSSFVVTSDLQGRELDKRRNRLVGEAVAEEIELLSELKEIPEVKVALLAGDLYDYPELHKLGGTGDVTPVWNAFASKFDSVVGVLGNHDTINSAELAKNARVLDGTSCEVAGIKVGGVSGIIGSSNRNQRKSEEVFLKCLQTVTGSRNDLILLHQGPDDPVNKQVGAPSITDHLSREGRGIVFFGHTPWQKPYISVGDHQVLNVDKRVYIVCAKN